MYLTGVVQLNFLYLDDNQLTTLSNGVFNGLTRLNFLSLSANQLNALNNGVFSDLTNQMT